jgi:hypothetical protein
MDKVQAISPIVSCVAGICTLVTCFIVSQLRHADTGGQLMIHRHSCFVIILLLLLLSSIYHHRAYCHNRSRKSRFIIASMNTTDAISCYVLQVSCGHTSVTLAGILQNDTFLPQVCGFIAIKYLILCSDTNDNIAIKEEKMQVLYQHA